VRANPAVGVQCGPGQARWTAVVQVSR
jgi:hypothetical protein